MWSSWRILAILIIAFLFESCKKEEVKWDKEADLTTDTSIYLNGVFHVSHTANEAFFDFEIVQFNQLECETNYSDIPIYSDASGYVYLELMSESVEVRPAIPSYSSVFLLERSGNDLNYFGEASFYLKRFFELSENKQPQRQIGLATYLNDNTNTLQVHKENGSLFGNSADYNDSILVDVIHKSEQYQGIHDETGEGLRQVMFALIDEIAADVSVIGEKSITLVDDYENNNNGGLSDESIDAIIVKAVQSGVKINGVCLSGDQYSRLAFGTGGFFIDDRDNLKVSYEGNDFERTLSSVGNNLANLDRILSHDLTVHKFRMRATPIGVFTFSSGNNISLELVYGNDLLRLYLRIP